MKPAMGSGRLALLFAALVAASTLAASAAQNPHPNILWISCEDTSPWMGFCGDNYAKTPHLDRLARRGVRYTNAYSSASVCSPARFSIITGIYATSMGTQHLRSTFSVPDWVKGFPSYLRQAGYYCSNNSKTDYNTRDEPRIIAESWDVSGGKAHWRNRQPGQPFFAVFNLPETHQSRIFEQFEMPSLDPSQKHDPAEAMVPPYYPDTPAARRTMARVQDCNTVMDARVGRILAELAEDGLEEETIVFFWSDHGQGIPRGKRTLWDTGLKVPLVIHFPEKYRHLAPAAAGESIDRIVSLIDLGPTLLSLLGLPVPAHLHGKAFLGKAAAPPRRYMVGVRDRVVDAMDLARSVRDERFLYIRNFRPDLSWHQPEFYSDQLELRREITRLATEGKLNEAQLTYAAATRPAEALYDTANDPWQVKNIAADPHYRDILRRMRQALHDWQIETRDLGFIPEPQAARMCANGRPLWDTTRKTAEYPLERIRTVAERIGHSINAGEFHRGLDDPDMTVRYWSAIGLRVSGDETEAAKAAWLRAMNDDSTSVQIEAAHTLIERWDYRPALQRLEELVRGIDTDTGLYAARALELLGEKARPALSTMKDVAAKTGHRDTRNSLTVAIERLVGPGKTP